MHCFINSPKTKKNKHTKINKIHERVEMNERERDRARGREKKITFKNEKKKTREIEI